ncbi:MAG TPA: hypothetical protein PKC29_15565 [Thermodesulfobacteriota bacterium]|mgnify:CR=1 FL=1|nr:hypothetical protein [Thermodesulfobacteriota bacterium]
MAKRGKGDGAGGVKEEDAAGDSAEKVFTEAEMNAELEARLEAERERIVADVEGRLRDAGVDGIDGVSDLVKRLREKDEAAETFAGERARSVEEAGERERRFEHELRRHEDESREWRGKYESLLRRSELTQAALKAGADPSNVGMIVTFTEGSVKAVEGGGFQVVGKNGAPMLDPETGAGMTVERYMRGFLSERPGLVRPSQARGAGTGALGGAQGRYTLEEIREIARTDPKRYAELKGEGVVQEVYERHLREG